MPEVAARFLIILSFLIETFVAILVLFSRTHKLPRNIDYYLFLGMTTGCIGFLFGNPSPNLPTQIGVSIWFGIDIAITYITLKVDEPLQTNLEKGTLFLVINGMLCFFRQAIVITSLIVASGTPNILVLLPALLIAVASKFYPDQRIRRLS